MANVFLTQILPEIMDLAILITGCFIIKKYVFLEPELEEKKQRIFYFASFLAAFVSYFAFGFDYSTASTAAMLVVAVNAVLARKKHRFYGLLLVMLPLSGIVDGLYWPVTTVIPYLLMMSERATVIYQFAAHGALFSLIALFYFKGRSWRSWFKENTQNRKLLWLEHCLLWLIAFLVEFYAMYAEDQIADGAIVTGEVYGEMLSSFLSISTFAVIVMTLTAIILIAQDNKRAFYQDKVLSMQSGMITLMADIVENRDDNTGGHIKRTANYVECIAKELKKRGAYKDILTDEYMKDLIVAAPLHDIGKIHIPDAVLNKPGRLTNEEYDIMKTHTTAGQALLNRAKEELGEYSYLTMAAEMAAYHHEWWNGKGYPYGKSGEEIPLCARIMAVADVFDALVSKRCYKDGMPLDKAYAIIREETGTHFDPEVAEAFFAAFPMPIASS